MEIDGAEDFYFNPNLSFKISLEENEVLRKLHLQYHIPEIELEKLFYYVKTHLITLKPVSDLDTKEAKQIEKFLSSNYKIESISFSDKAGQVLRIKDKALIEKLSYFYELMEKRLKHHNWFEFDTDKEIRKDGAKTLHKRLNEKLNQTEFKASVIIGHLYCYYEIPTATGQKIKTKEEKEPISFSKYENYLEENIRRLLTS